MSEPHRIRLRGPWEVVGLQPERPATRMPLPCTWREGGWPGFAGRASHIRQFGQPRTHGAGERVWLFIEAVVGRGVARLNGRELGAVDGLFRVDVTDQLLARNQLEIDVECDRDEGKSDRLRP